MRKRLLFTIPSYSKSVGTISKIYYDFKFSILLRMWQRIKKAEDFTHSTVRILHDSASWECVTPFYSSVEYNARLMTHLNKKVGEPIDIASFTPSQAEHRGRMRVKVWSLSFSTDGIVGFIVKWILIVYVYGIMVLPIDYILPKSQHPYFFQENK